MKAIGGAWQDRVCRLPSQWVDKVHTSTVSELLCFFIYLHLLRLAWPEFLVSTLSYDNSIQEEIEFVNSAYFTGWPSFVCRTVVGTSSLRPAGNSLPGSNQASNQAMNCQPDAVNWSLPRPRLLDGLVQQHDEHPISQTERSVCEIIYTFPRYLFAMGSRRSRPKARGVIFTPGGA